MNILISLEKQYFDQIKQGIKKYEYRRKFVKVPCTAFLYISNPEMAIMGYMDLEKPYIDNPQALGEFAENQVKGIGKEIEEYMEGLDVGYASAIKTLYEIEPVPLDFLRQNFEGFTAPQGYIILDRKPDLLKFLKSQQVINKWNLQ